MTVIRQVVFDISGKRVSKGYEVLNLLEDGLFLGYTENSGGWTGSCELGNVKGEILLEGLNYAELTGDYLVLYEKDGKYGAFDYWGNTVEEASYDTLGELKDALGYWTLAKDGDLYGYQNSKGEWVIEPQFTAAEEFINPFGSGCVNYAYVETPKCHGYINSEGEFFAVLPEGNDAEVEVIVNGEYVEFDVPPMLENDRTLVPMRAIFEALGAEVSWYPEDRTIVAVRGGTTVFMQVDDWYMSVNDEWIRLDAPPRIVNDRTLIPLRAVAEAFGAQVGWDEATQTVTVELD